MLSTITDRKGPASHGAWFWRTAAVPLLLALLALGVVGASTALASSSTPLRPAVVSPQHADAAPAMAPLNGPTMYVGWTGRNAAHNLNLMTYDPINRAFSPAQTLTETTLLGSGPSLATFNSNLYVAWQGTDHRLNVGRYNPADPTHLANKVTLSESSHDAPSIAAFMGRLYLSWRGTDGRLNLISSADAIHFDTKVTYGIAAKTSPSLVNADLFLYVFWEDVSPSSSIVVGHLEQPLPPVLTGVITLTSTSQLPVGVAKAPFGAPGVKVAWRTASDPHILLGTFQGDSVLHNTVATAETTPYGPALSNEAPGTYDFLGWTGGDADQHVNVGRLAS